MNWLTELRYGCAAVSADESDGLLAFAEPDKVAIVGTIPIVGLVMPEQPDECVAMNMGVLDESAETTTRLTFRMRAHSEARLDLIGDTLDNIWTKRDAGMLGNARLIMSQWSSGATLGQDGSKRIERSANYYLTVARPLVNRY